MEGHQKQPTHDDHPHRHWLHAHGHTALQHQESFLIMSYNTLADANARTHSHDLSKHMPALITDWEDRKNSLLLELQLWTPDVICLQEVDRYPEFVVELQRVGYLWVYKKRTGASRDGCAVFWREERFALLEEEDIEFHDYKLRDNVAQVCVLERKRGCGGLGFQDRVVVGNVYVMFNLLRGDVTLGQARVLMKKVHSMSGKWGNVPVVVAGDFNSTPWSPLYRFLSSSSLDLVGLDRRCISGQEEGGESERSSKNRVSECERFGTASRSIRRELVSDHEALKQSGKVSRKKIPALKKVGTNSR